MSRSTQPGKTSASAGPYLTWQDLLAEAENDATLADAVVSTGQPPTAAAADEPWPATAQVQLPPDVTALLAEKERLEYELKRLTGLGTPRPEDERQQRMYPVKAHTKESRIEDRRLRQHDERQRMRKQRALEAKLARSREEQHQAELEAERRRKAIERALLALHAQLHQAELEAERRRKAIERAQAALREQQRQAEDAAERQRKAVEQAAIQARWAGDRQKALIKRAQERRRAALGQEEDLHDQRRRVVQLAQTRKEQQQDGFSKEQVKQTRQQGRADEARRTARPEQQSAQLRDVADVSGRASASARLDALQRLYQKKRQALAWEQTQEQLRADALQRRRENQRLSDRLDQRSKNTDRFAAT